MSDLEVKQAVYYILIVYIRVQCTMVLVGYFDPKRKHVRYCTPILFRDFRVQGANGEFQNKFCVCKQQVEETFL